MLKKVIILGILISVLLGLIVVLSKTNTPVINQINNSIEYIAVEYKINKIEGDQYYGINGDGEKIVFSANRISSDESIEEGDTVICYFEKGNIGNGIVMVEKK